MANAADDKEFRHRMERIEALLQAVEDFPDPQTRTRTREIVQALLDFHGTALARLMEVLGEADHSQVAALGADDLVGSLLLLYGLHPLGLETRVRQALDSVRPYLRSHGGSVELVGLADGAVRLRMQGSCKSCPSSAQTLEHAIVEAIHAKAPDVTAIDVEGIEEAPAAVPSNFIPVQELHLKNGHAGASAASAQLVATGAELSGNPRSPS